MEQLATIIKTARRQMFMTQQELATELGVSCTTVNRWENGKCVSSLRIQKAFIELCKRNGINPEL